MSREDAGSDLAGDLSSGVAGGRDGDMVAAMIPPKQVAATTKANGHAEVRAAELDQPLSRCTPRSEPKPRPVVAPAEQQLEVVLHRRGGGLGLGLDEDMRVTEVLAGGPAHVSGVLVHDVLLKVNGEPFVPEQGFGGHSDPSRLESRKERLAALMPHSSQEVSLTLRRLVKTRDSGTKD